MDYKKLAELLFPNVKLSPCDLEKRYPKRNLKNGEEVTRFAPSPTGYLHLGNFFGALIDFRIAKDSGGVFYFRLEDTDSKREVKNADFIALDVLSKFGIIPDEGLRADGKEYGNYEPYRQSSRAEIYQVYAKDLVRKGKAFPCFCEAASNKQEIEERRAEELEVCDSIEEKDVCRNLSFEDIEKYIKSGKKFAIRLRSDGKEGERIKFVDEIRGEREFAKNCKDVVLVKSNGIPPYAFAHPIDDHLMKTTLVVRGEDWLSTLPQHIEIFEALGFDRVRYAHTPLISKIADNGNKRKLSKRLDPEADMRYYFAEGFYKTAIVEYLLNIINSNFEDWRRQNPTLDNNEFKVSVSRIGSSSPIFDLAKLLDISKNLISVLSAQIVYELALEWAKEYDNAFAQFLECNKVYSIKVFNIDRDKPKPRKDLAKWSDIKVQLPYMFDCYTKLDKLSDFEMEGLFYERIKDVISAYRTVINFDDSKEQWFERIKAMAGSLGYAADSKEYRLDPLRYLGNTSDICTYIRIALTGRKNSPDLYEIIEVLGKQRVLDRLDKMIDLL